MAVNLSPVGGVAAQFFDNSGNVLTGGKLYTYLAGTTTPATTYTTSSGNTAQPNPIVFNAAGRVPDSGEIWLSDGVLYKFSLQDQYGVQIATYDNIDGINSNFVSYTSQNEVQTATQGQTIFTLTTIQYTPATNNLAVYVNGSKQIDPTNYVETGSTTVTFVSGLNVGDVVEFNTATPVSSNATSAANVSYNEGGTGAINTTVEAKLQESVSVKDFGAVGDGTTDDTNAFNSALTALANGGTLLIPLGRYLITDTLTLNTGITIQGQGNADRTFGTPNTSANSSYIFQTTASKSVFKINGNTRQIRIKDISLGSKLNVNLVSSTTINGISMAGTYSNSSTDIVIERCGFYNFNKAISVVDTALPGSLNPDWQCDNVSLNNCTFYMNKDGVYFYTTNADSWVFTNCDFFTGDNANGLHLNRCGTFTAINCFGGDIAPATPGSPIAAYGILVNGDGYIDTTKFINCQWEATTNMLRVETSYYPNQFVGAMKIIMDSCEIEDDITIAAAINYISFASRYNNSVYVTGSNAIIESYSDYFISPSNYVITGSNSVLNTAITSSQTSVNAANNGWILGGIKNSPQTTYPTTLSTASWNKSDIVWNSNAVAGNVVGWVCTVAGNPGTWQPFGQAGFRSAASTPVGVFTPFFIGEEYLDTNANKWYKSIGLANTNWVALN